MERKDYLTTGELAQLMGITKHTLFHYDDIGLFQPEYIMKTVTASIPLIRLRF